MNKKFTTLLFLPALLLGSCAGHGSKLTKEEAGVKINEIKAASESALENQNQLTITSVTNASQDSNDVKTKSISAVDFEKVYIRVESNQNIISDDENLELDQTTWLYKDGDKLIYAVEINLSSGTLTQKDSYYYSFDYSDIAFMEQAYDYDMLSIFDSIDVTNCLLSLELAFGYTDIASYEVYSKGSGHLYFTIIQDSKTDYPSGDKSLVIKASLECEIINNILSSYEMDAETYELEANNMKSDVTKVYSKIDVKTSAKVSYPNLNNFRLSTLK